MTRIHWRAVALCVYCFAAYSALVYWCGTAWGWPLWAIAGVALGFNALVADVFLQRGLRLLHGGTDAE